MSSYEKDKQLERTREFLEFIKEQEKNELLQKTQQLEVVGKSDKLKNEVFGNSEQLKKD